MGKGFWKAVTAVAGAVVPGMKYEGVVISSVEDLPSTRYIQHNEYKFDDHTSVYHKETVVPDKVAIHRNGRARCIVDPDALVSVEIWQEVAPATPSELEAAREQLAKEYEEGQRWLLD